MNEHHTNPDADRPGGDQEPAGDPGALIRGALLRKSLADATQRGALARRLALTDTEVLAIQHLALSGELTPGQLANLLQLSSGGTTGLIQRLKHAGHVTRHPHPRDNRSKIVRLTPEIAAWAADAWQPYTTQLDAITATLTPHEQDAVRRYLDAAAHAAEHHAQRLAHDADTSAHDQLAVPLPALWA
jgi:DNA-binding MarR family transcriptional regulator